MAWDYQDYWVAVFGDRSAEQVVEELGLDTRDREALYVRVGQAERKAAEETGIEVPGEWDDYHECAVLDLVKAGGKKAPWPPHEISYRNNRGEWSRRLFKRESAFDRFVDRMNEEAREFYAREA